MMKQAIKMIGMAAAVLTLATFAWAATETIGSGGNSTTFETSPNVDLAYTGTATGSSYAATSFNTQGTQHYGVDADFTGMYIQAAGSSDSAAKTPPTPVANASSEFGSGWSALGS